MGKSTISMGIHCRLSIPAARFAKQTHFHCTRRWQRYRGPKDVTVAMEFSDQIKPQNQAETTVTLW